MGKYVVIYAGLPPDDADRESVTAASKRWFVRADNLTAAAEMVSGGPGLANATIEVYETVPFG